MEILNEFMTTSVGRVLLSGAVVNFFLVIIGTLLGLLFKKGLPERIQNVLMTAMAFCVFYIGVTGIFDENANILVIIACMAIGAVIGEVLDLDKLVNKIGEGIEKKFNKNGNNLSIAKGFVSATLLFCVGAMTIVGSIDSGIKGDNATLYSKSVIDCVAAIALTSSLGIGVIFSALSVLFIEGGLTLIATVVSPF